MVVDLDTSSDWVTFSSALVVLQRQWEEFVVVDDHVMGDFALDQMASYSAGNVHVCFVCLVAFDAIFLQLKVWNTEINKIANGAEIIVVFFDNSNIKTCRP